MKNISLIGSTGSIGENALAVIKAHPEHFRVVGLAAKSNIRKLRRQIEEFHPKMVCVYEESAARILERRLGKAKVKIVTGESGLKEVARISEVDTVLCGAVGAGGLSAIFAAIESGKDVGIANKEPLVMAGDLIMQKAKKRRVRILPIDSEHSAIWQCLHGQNGRAHIEVKRLILTASGGPFLGKKKDELTNITPAEAIKHPRWRMGKKISVDSATLMNKGLEIKEAHHLFNVPIEKIDILIHPEAVIHSMVEFVDGSHMAQLAVNDMKLPIQYALSYPHRFEMNLPKLDFVKIRSLTFDLPDRRTFPCLNLAYEVWKQGGTAPAVLNAANEIAVDRFLNGQLTFLGIPRLIERVLSSHKNKSNPDLEAILEADRWAREKALTL